jgi:uncharacterized protein YggE
MRIAVALSLLFFSAAVCHAQISGNVAYTQGGGRMRAEATERAKRVLSDSEKPVGNSMFLDAGVLMNVKADEYVAVFALAQEAPTVAECNTKMDALIKDFTAALKPLGIASDNIAVDFIAQNKTYGFQVDSKIAKEKLVGFDLKKNVSLRYKDAKTLDKVMVAAAGLQIFDLVKVDYIVKDHEAVQNKLIEEAARVIKNKAARHEKLLGVKLAPRPQVHVERTSIYYPTEMYDSYVPQESEQMDVPIDRSKFLIQGARKGRTFYYNPVTASGFDAVLNPIISEPVVQFTAYVRLKYEIDGKPGKAKK